MKAEQLNDNRITMTFLITLTFNNMKFLQLILFIFLIFTSAFSQVVYEPMHNDVYNYLDRLSRKGLIDFNALFKPLPRKYIYEKLLDAESKIDKLTGLEKEELQFL